MRTVPLRNFCQKDGLQTILTGIESNIQSFFSSWPLTKSLWKFLSWLLLFLLTVRDITICLFVCLCLTLNCWLRFFKMIFFNQFLTYYQYKLGQMKRGSGKSILKAFLYTMSICLSGYQSICLSDRLYSIQLSVCLPSPYPVQLYHATDSFVNLSNWLSVALQSNCLSVCPPICLSTHLSAYLSYCL